MKNFLLVMLFAFSLIFVSCEDKDDTSTSMLTLNSSGLEDLGPDYVYEGWILVDGNPISTGTFTSTVSSQSFPVDALDLMNATTFVLTIEPSGETGINADTPSATKILAGDFNGDSAALSLSPVANFESSNSGTFFLRSPTDEMAGTDNNGNDENGIWFGIPGAPPTSGLTLPILNDGWKYEGWVVVDGIGPLSTGTFTSFDNADDNAGAATSFSGTENAGPPIPGEDFFNNAPAGFTFPLDIRGKTVVISVEPYPDNSPMPFLLKPLVGTAGNDTAPVTYDLSFSDASFPTGNVSR